MPARLANLVLGPESSGTRLMTRLLIEAGCEGEDGAAQRWDTLLPNGESPVVWRRSFPHAKQWPDIGEMARGLHERDYDVRAVVMVRDWYPAQESQVSIGHVPDRETARANLRRAALDILLQCDEAGVPFVQVTYEGLVHRPEQVLAWLVGWLRLEMPAHEIYDGDEKWWRTMDKYILEKDGETVEVFYPARRDRLLGYGYTLVEPEKPKERPKGRRRSEEPPKDLKRLAEEVSEESDELAKEEGEE